MDQDAFRSLLATPARSSDQGRSPSSRPPATTSSRFGIAPPKRALAQSLSPRARSTSHISERAERASLTARPNASSSEDLSTDLKPRKVTTTKPRRNPDGSLYRDRAAERRAGRDGDFADAEKLLEDFKTRSETAGVSKDVLEDQMKYLGGDEHHSILVKGLDIALLERKKAELAQKAERELDDVEDELDAAFKEPPAASPSPPRPSTSTARGTGTGAGAGAGGARQTLSKRKKTRDELIAEMKAMRAGQAATGASEGGAGAPSESRFKPIGSTSADKKGKGKETASGGWKTVGGGGGGAGVGEGGEKKKRKKRKVVPPTAAAADQTAPDSAPPSASATASAPPPPPSKELPSSAPPTASAPAPAPVPDDDDDDMDIFGDVGDYKGLDTDEESDAGGGQGGPAPSTTTGTGKRKYFDDDDDEEEEIGTSTAPTGLEDLAAKQAAANAAAAAAGGAGPKASASAGGGEQDEEREEDRPMRLEGLSGAGPSVKELLEMDKAAEAEEKRQARKLKAKEKAEARRANMTEADKANQDYQKMMAHLEKKDGPGGGGGKKHSP